MWRRIACCAGVAALVAFGLSLAALPATAAAPVGSSTITWTDDFGGASLDGRWSWVREDASHWSLAANPGSLRIVTQAGGLYLASNNLKNLLLTSAPLGDYQITTKVTITPVQNFQFAALQIYQDDDNYVEINRGYAYSDSVYFGVEIGGVYTGTRLWVSGSTVYLRIARQGSTYVGYYSEDGDHWRRVGERSATLVDPKVGIGAANNLDGVPEIAADFDYFRMDDYSQWWTDSFDSASLRSRWKWVREDPTHWSLAARPGFMRIVTQWGGFYYPGPGDAKNLLVQDVPVGDFEMQTRVFFWPTNNVQSAGLIVYQDDDNYVDLIRAYCGFPGCKGNAIYFDKQEQGQTIGTDLAITTTLPGEAYLRLVRHSEFYTGYVSVDGMDWRLIGTHTVVSGLAPSRIGLLAINGEIAAPEINADFDFFRLDDRSYRTFLPMVVRW